MNPSVSCRSFAPTRMTPNPRHDSARAATGSRCAMSSASAFEAASMTIRTEMTLPWWSGRSGGRPTHTASPRFGGPSTARRLAVEPLAPNAHVREEQDDEDDRKDDVQQHVPPVLNEVKLSCAVSSGFEAMSPPSGGFATDDVGVIAAS